MPKVVWTSENDRKLLIRLIERSAKSYDTVELCKIFPGATPKAIEERIAKLKREAKAMDHPKPRNHPKGKSGPKKRVATEASLAPVENIDTKKIRMVTDSVTDPVEDSITDTLSVPDVADISDALCPTKVEDDEQLPPESPSVKCEPEAEFGSDSDPEASPEAESSVEPSAEPEIDSDFEPDDKPEFKSEGEEDEYQQPLLIKSEF